MEILNIESGSRIRLDPTPSNSERSKVSIAGCFLIQNRQSRYKKIDFKSSLINILVY